MNGVKTCEDIYRAYRYAQSIERGYPQRFPRDFEKHMNERMSDVNRKALKTITNWFNTKWSGINPERYFECGFELFAKFTYHQFADPRVIKLYIQRDKMIKRKAELSKREIIESVKFVKKYIAENNIRNFSIYCLVREDGKCLPIAHYLDNKIDRYFLTWMLREKMIHLTDYEFSVIPYITDKYRDILEELKEIDLFLKKVKEKL